MVSAGSRLLPSDVLLLSEKPTTLAPRRCMEVSKERRVRVEASKKQLAITLCFSSSGCGLAFSFAAVSRTSSSSSRLRSFMEMMCFDKADSCLSPDAGQKAPQMRGSGNRLSNGKKNGRPASDFRRGKTLCRTRLTMLPPGKLSGIIRSSLCGSSDLMHALLNANGSL